MKSLALILTILLLSTVSYSQNGVWVHYTTANSGLFSDTITLVAVDGNNNLWLGTAGRSIDYYDGTTWKSYYRDVSHIPTPDIFDLNYSNGSMWIGQRVGLTRFDGTTWTQYTEQNSGLVNSPIVDLANDQQSLWIGTARGLSRLTPAGDWTTYTTTNTPSIHYNGIKAIAVDAANNVWLSFINTAGFTKFPGGNSSQGKYYRWDTIQNFPQGYTTSLTVDHSGNLWAGMEHGGVVKINASGATPFSTQNTSAFKNNNTHRITVDQCGHVWVANEGGAVMYDGTSWLTVNKASGALLSDWVNTVYVDQYGHVWFGTYGGVSEFKPLPEKPDLITPAHQATIVTDSITCRWAQSCPNIQKYWYELADNSDFTNSKIDTTSASLTTSMSHWDSAFQNNITYYWRVKAKNDAGWGPFSNTWTFTVNKPVGAVAARSNFDCDLSLFPNPTGTGIVLRFSLPRREHCSVTIVDEAGRIVSGVANGIFDGGIHEIPFNSNTLANGPYRVSLRGEDVNASTSLIIAR